MTTPSDTTTLNSDNLPPWDDLDAKKEIFVKIIGEILTSPELGQKYVDDPTAAKEDIKKLIKVPDHVKIVFLPAGDSDIEGGGSVVIELPPAHSEGMSWGDKMELFLCTYNPW